MKKIFLFAAALFTAGNLHAFELSSAESGVQLSSVPGTQFSKDPVLRIQRPDRPVNGIVEINARKELIFRPEPGKSDAEFGVILPLPAKVSRVKITFDLKGVDFFVSRKNKEYNRFMFYFGGINMMLRGNAFGLRYYNVDRKTYIHGITFRNDQWQTITLDMTCGAKPVYSLNDIKDIVQRGNCEFINRLTFYGKFINAQPNTAVYIRNLKVELPEI